jgi:bacillithiol biosynthesis cysteine-adding enzyme BshC
LKQIVAPSPERANAALPASSLPFSAVPHQSKLFLDHLRDPRSLRNYYPNAVSSVSDIARFVPDVLQDYRCDRDRLCHALTETNQAIGAGEKTFSNISLLSEKDTVAVVTGQQAGLFTGPLYTIYKALTAIKLSVQLTSEGVKAVPVFWAATEDHDLDEVAKACFIGRDADLIEIEYRPQQYVKNSPVGNIRVDGSIDAAVQRLFEGLSATEFSLEVRQSIAGAWHQGTDFGHAFQTELAGLLGKHGLIFIDPMADGIKTLAAPIYSDAIARGDQIVAAIRERDSQLAADGYHSQVVVEEDYFPFFWLSDDGRRLALRRVGNGVYRAKDNGREFTRAELAEMAANEPQRLSPGVMLRPVVQDHLLPTACYVGGAAEIAYFAQNSEAYRILERPVTPIVHRQSVTVIESKHKRTLEKFGLELKELFDGVDAVLEGVGEDQLSRETADRFDAAENSISRNLDDLERELARIDPTLLRNIAKRREKMLYHISALRKKANLAQLRKDKTSERQLREAMTALLPNGELQERVINVNSFLNKYGPYFIDLVYDSIEPDNKEHLLISI